MGESVSMLICLFCFDDRLPISPNLGRWFCIVARKNYAEKIINCEIIITQSSSKGLKMKTDWKNSNKASAKNTQQDLARHRQTQEKFHLKAYHFLPNGFRRRQSTLSRKKQSKSFAYKRGALFSFWKYPKSVVKGNSWNSGSDIFNVHCSLVTLDVLSKIGLRNREFEKSGGGGGSLQGANEGGKTTFDSSYGKVEKARTREIGIELSWVVSMYRTILKLSFSCFYCSLTFWPFCWSRRSVISSHSLQSVWNVDRSCNA